MGIALREKVNSDNTKSLYLDIYHNGKRTYEFLQLLKVIIKPSSPLEREQNKTNKKLAQKILAKRQQDLESSDWEITPAFRQNIDFTEFFKAFKDKYKKKDLRVIEACYKRFKSFLKESDIKTLTAKQLTPSVVNEFKNYLNDNLTGESPANYFKKFKLVINEALRQNILLKNPALDIKIKTTQGIKKHILTPEEVQLLVKVPVTNNEIKKAFIFSLFTGLRFSDIKSLKWHNIDFNNEILNIIQEKTNQKVSLNLHKSALNAIGKPKKPNDFVFDLPTHTACTKGVKHWVKKAGINKNITWHCARHSFATNLIYFGADVNTASKLLGHTSFRYTERYTHIVKSLKDKAISNLPEANF